MGIQIEKAQQLEADAHEIAKATGEFLHNESRLRYTDGRDATLVTRIAAGVLVGAMLECFGRGYDGGLFAASVEAGRRSMIEAQEKR